jgi:hypothetical protein
MSSLGEESCHRVALILAAGRVPFIYVTGHEQHSLPELPNAPWVVNSYRDEDIIDAILEACPATVDS